MRRRADVDGPTWFTGGRRKSLTFHVDEADAVVEAAAGAEPKTAYRDSRRRKKQETTRSRRTIPSSRRRTGRDEEESFVTEPTVIDAMDETQRGRATRPTGGGSSSQPPPTGASTPARAGTRASPAAWRASSGSQTRPSGDAKNTRRTLLAAADGGRRPRRAPPPRHLPAGAATMALAPRRGSRAPRARREAPARAPPAPPPSPPRSSTPRTGAPPPCLAPRGRATSAPPATAPLLAVAAMAGYRVRRPLRRLVHRLLGDAVSEAAGILAAREAAARLGEPGEPSRRRHRPMPAARADGLPRQGIRVPPRRPRAHPGRRADRGRALLMGASSRTARGRPGPQPRGPERACEHRVDISQPPRRSRLHVRPRGGRFERSVTPRAASSLPRDPGCEWYTRTASRARRRMANSTSADCARRRRRRLGRSQGWR